MALKVIVLLLLAFGGIAEAIHCYRCSGQNGRCTGANPVDVECAPSNTDGCLITKQTSSLQLTCGLRGEGFYCVQQVLGQSGCCINGSQSDVAIAQALCDYEEEIGRSNGKPEIMTYDLRDNTVNSQASGQDAKQVGWYTACFCDTDLCNTEKLLEQDYISCSKIPTRPTTTPTTTTCATQPPTTTEKTSPPTTAENTPPAGTSAEPTTTDDSTDDTSASTEGQTAPPIYIAACGDDSGTAGQMVNAGILAGSVVVILMTKLLFH